VLEFLLLKGANPNVLNKKGQNALFTELIFYANINNNNDFHNSHGRDFGNCVNILILYGIDCNMKYKSNFSCLYYLLLEKNFSINIQRYKYINHLILGGIDINIQNTDGSTILDIYLNNNKDLFITEFLLKIGAKIFKKQKNKIIYDEIHLL